MDMVELLHGQLRMVIVSQLMIIVSASQNPWSGRQLHKV